MALTTFDTGLAVFRESPVHALMIIVLMTGKTGVRIGQLDIPATTLSQVFSGWRMATKAIAVINIDPMLLIRLMTGFTGFITRRYRGLCLKRGLCRNLCPGLARQSHQTQGRQ
jgi:hypothetical protein